MSYTLYRKLVGGLEAKGRKEIHPLFYVSDNHYQVSDEAASIFFFIKSLFCWFCDFKDLWLHPPSWITALPWWRGLCNSMKLTAKLCRVTEDQWVTVESSDKMCSTGGGNGKPFQYTCHENLMNCIKGQKYMTPKNEFPRVQRYPIFYWGRAEENYQ